MDLLYKVKKVIEKYNLINSKETVLLGVSGGMDSVVMFHILLKLSEKMDFKLGVAHVNHQLRGGESDRDEAFVRDMAQRCNVPFYSGRFDVRSYAKEKDISIQHGARDIRYDFFHDIALKHNYHKIAIAHNLDDQVETFMLRLIKGSGLRGLSSIPIKRDRVIRPLLFTYRHEIEEYAKANYIQHVEDSSNEKTYYERNFIRKNIIPTMERLNPAFKEKIFLLLQDITETDSFFQTQASDFLKEFLYSHKNEFSVKIDDYRALDNQTRFKVFTGIISELGSGFIPLRQHMHLVDKIVNSYRPNLSLNLPKGIRVKRVYDRLVFTKNPPIESCTIHMDIHEGINILEPFGIALEVERYPKKDIFPFTKPIEARLSENIAFFDKDKIGRLTVRCFSEGDRFMPLGMDQIVKVKDFFISRKIPLDKRRNIPFLISDREIIWIVGHRIDNRFKVTEDTKDVLKVTASALPSKRDGQSD